MKIAFLNLCHTDPAMVARAAQKLTGSNQFDMYVHVDAKVDIAPFQTALAHLPKTYLLQQRHKVYWGGFNAVKATVELLRQALASQQGYEYFVVLQNLDYPIRSNDEIYTFFAQNPNVEYVRGCKIAQTKDWHYARKYKIYNKRDDDFYLKNHGTVRRYLRYLRLRLQSMGTVFFNGVIQEHDGAYPMYYGAAQWAVTRQCARYIVDFYDTHPAFNKIMAHVQFPDEEYFHTVVHNSAFKESCVRYNEPEKRWLVNWRNLHYFEYPKEIVVFTEKDFDKLREQDALFIRKVRTGVSDALLDQIDAVTG